MAARLISIDEGNGNVKVVTSKGRFGFQSVYGVASNMIDDFGGGVFKPNHDYLLRIEDQIYSIGETVYFRGVTPVSVHHESRVEDPFYKILFMAALSLSLGGSCTVEPVLSLPPRYYNRKEVVKDLLAGTYTFGVFDPKVKEWKTQTYVVPYELMKIIPEGMGTVCSMVLKPNGGEYPNTDLHKKVVGIVDIGTYTTDLVMLDQLRLVKSGTDSIEQALSKLYQGIKEYADSESVTIHGYELDKAFKSGYFLKSGNRVPLAPIIHRWAQNLSEAIVAAIRSKWNGGDAVEQIVVTGGGAEVIAPFIMKAFKHARIVETPDNIEHYYTNAEGGYRFGMMLKAMGK